MMRKRIFILVLLMAAGVLAGSCREKEDPEESISVNPASIEASSDLASYKIEVSANCSWTVSAEDGNGEEALWLTPDRNSGHDNATVTIRVTENKYVDARTASVAFSTAGGKRAVVQIRQSGNDSGQSSGKTAVRLGSYNLRMHNLDTDGDNKWDVRKDRLRQSIEDCDFDVFGIQEVSSTMQTWLKSEFGSRYTFFFFSP